MGSSGTANGRWSLSHHFCVTSSKQAKVGKDFQSLIFWWLLADLHEISGLYPVPWRQMSSWNKCHRIMSFVAVPAENAETEAAQRPSRRWPIQAGLRHADSVKRKDLLCCSLSDEQKFSFYWCSFRISKSYLFPVSSVPLTDEKNPQTAVFMDED